MALFRLGEFERSERMFSDVTEAKPDDATAVYYLGLCAERLGRPEEALSRYERAAELDPDVGKVQQKIEELSGRTDDGGADVADHAEGASRSEQGGRRPPDPEDRRMREFDLPAGEEGMEEYERRLAERQRARRSAAWKGQPWPAKVLGVAVLVFMVAVFVVVAVSFVRSFQEPFG